MTTDSAHPDVMTDGRFNAFTRGEVNSTYVDVDERFVVSLVVGYGTGEVATPLEACKAALELTRDMGSDGTQWWVYDRETKTMQMYEQDEFEELEHI